MKVALVHDYLREYGGAERVLEDLHEIFPEAPIYTAYLRPEGLGKAWQRFKDWDIRTSWMQKLPLANKLISPFRIFAAGAFESFDLSEFDMVISSSAIYFAKAVITKPGALHIAYIHTPPRYLYGYVTSYNYKKHWLTRVGGEVTNHFLRIVDFETSQRPDILVTNSQEVRSRIKKFYRRDSVVINPAVDITPFKKSRKKVGDYYLYLGRLVRGKGVDVIVEAFTRLNLPLKVAGTGPILGELKKRAGRNIEFLGPVSEEEKVKLYSGARAFVSASEDEDFGITQIEAQAAGTAVIAIRAGGYLETIIDGKTGQFFDSAGEAASFKSAFNEQTVLNLITVLEKFEPKVYKEEDCRANAERFSKERFKKEILDLVQSSYARVTRG